MPILLRWILGTVLAVIFVVAALGNAWTVIRYIVHKRRSSAAPLVGGLCGVGSCLVLPLANLNEWWWLPLLLDYGSLPVLAVSAVLGLVALLREST